MLKLLKITLLLSFVLPSYGYAITESARTMLLMRLMQARQQKEISHSISEKDKPTNINNVITGSVVFSQSSENGAIPVSIFETKECGRLGYLPKEIEGSDFSDAKEVSIRVKDCIIQSVEALKK